MNLPLAVLPLGIFAVCFRPERPVSRSWEQLRGADWAGIMIFSGSISAILFALVTGTNASAWSSPPILTSLILGLVGLGAFVAYEGLIAGNFGLGEPFIPLRLFAHRTAAFGFLITLLHAMILWAIPYYFLLYVSEHQRLGNNLWLTFR